MQVTVADICSDILHYIAQNDKYPHPGDQYPEAILYLIDILREENVKIYSFDCFTITCLINKISSFFYWSPKYPTYFGVVDESLKPSSSVLSFAVGSEAIREYIRVVR